ncbi:hypothetical protein BKA70DRAFT_1562361 [Coprinopsis sp. MPI-PUGE-AT-0042]|nr:hypothetical protein BKA70DRAFT_1562361 [Coprinopsis sp. MPI-PUGE-AT-0042]
MASTLKIDSRILPYTRNNDLLPAKLKPILDKQLEDVSTLQEELGRQKQAKIQHATMIQTLVSTVSVVRRLPPEILALIITFSVMDVPSRSQHLRLMRLCDVSQLWRNTALSTPSLWRYLPIDLERFEPRKDAKALLNSTLDSWLSRAGDGGLIALEFYLETSEQVGLSSHPRARDVVAWIQGSNFTLTSLKFDNIFSSTKELETLLCSNAPSLSSTKELHLALPQLPSSPSDLGQALRLDIESTMPILDRVTLTGGLYREPSVELVHPTLSTLQIMDMDLAPVDVTTMIRSLPALRSMALMNCPPWNDEEYYDFEEEHDLFLHRSLRFISLGGDFFSTFCNKLMCPALERLTLNRSSAYGPEYRGDGAHGDGAHGDSAKALGLLIRRSQTSAVAVHISGFFHPEFINTLLSTSSPKVRELHLERPSCLPLERIEASPQLVIPNTLQFIQCIGSMLEEGSNVWISKLGECLQEPSSQTLSVQFGEGEAAFVKHV